MTEEQLKRAMCICEKPDGEGWHARVYFHGGAIEGAIYLPIDGMVQVDSYDNERTAVVEVAAITAIERLDDIELAKRSAKGEA